MSKRVILMGADITPLVKKVSVSFDEAGSCINLSMSNGDEVSVDESYIEITNKPRESAEPMTTSVSNDFGRKVILLGVDITSIVRSVWLSTSTSSIDITCVDEFESSYSSQYIKIVNTAEGDNAGN